MPMAASYISSDSAESDKRYEPNSKAPLFARSVEKNIPAAPLNSPVKRVEVSANLSPFLRAKNAMRANESVIALVSIKYENSILEAKIAEFTASCLNINEKIKQKNAKYNPKYLIVFSPQIPKLAIIAKTANITARRGILAPSLR